MSTLMRRQLRAEKDAAAVEGDVGCVVPLSVVGEGDPRGGAFAVGPDWRPGLRVSPVGGGLVVCGCWQLE